MIKWRQDVKTEWGNIAMQWSENGLWALYLPMDEIQKDSYDELSESESQKVKTTTKMIAKKWRDSSDTLALSLKKYFAGERVEWCVPLDFSGYTSFQKKVLVATSRIKYGKVLTYKDVARLAGNEKAARAAGGALHVNRLTLVVPCHRVIGSNGKLVGFAGGIDFKAKLLALEKGV